jgi:hypothetical protein
LLLLQQKSRQSESSSAFEDMCVYVFVCVSACRRGTPFVCVQKLQVASRPALFAHCPNEKRGPFVVSPPIVVVLSKKGVSFDPSTSFLPSCGLLSLARSLLHLCSSLNPLYRCWFIASPTSHALFQHRSKKKKQKSIRGEKELENGCKL